MLKEILESAVLTDDVKTNLSEAFEHAIEEKRVELEEQYQLLREALEEETIASIHAIVENTLEEEVANLADELNHARTLEVQYADKLEQFKEDYANEAAQIVQETVSETVADELAQLHEDIEQAKRNAFGQKIFEAFEEAYHSNFGGQDVDVVQQLREAQEQLEVYERESIIGNLLEGFSGRKRNIMETMLDSTPTDKLYERFESIHSLILTESATDYGAESYDEDDYSDSYFVENYSQDQHEDTQIDEAQMVLAKSLKF